MGAWGTESFDNDAAMDWVAELEAATDLRAVADALGAAASEEYLDADVGSVGLAAAEVVAALRGRPAAELPEEVAAWVEGHRVPPDAALLGAAVRAVDAIAGEPERSELRELWDEAADDDRAAWRAAVADLRDRLA